MDACWAPTYLSDGTNDETQAVKIAHSLRWMQTMSVLSTALLLILIGSFWWWTQVEVGLLDSRESEDLFLDVTPLLLQRHFQRTCRIYAKQAKLPSNDAGGETPLSSPERQATTAMPLRISRTPLQLGTIPSGNFHPHPYPFCCSHACNLIIPEVVFHLVARPDSECIREPWFMTTPLPKKCKYISIGRDCFR